MLLGTLQQVQFAEIIILQKYCSPSAKCDASAM